MTRKKEVTGNEAISEMRAASKAASTLRTRPLETPTLAEPSKLELRLMHYWGKTLYELIPEDYRPRGRKPVLKRGVEVDKNKLKVMEWPVDLLQAFFMFAKLERSPKICWEKVGAEMVDRQNGNGVN
ncbi:hypothetical protein LTR85_005414 [Meristemomyces frigidus]|nr:hypothetical protein LTR85_005414 [Meristemomyces frigidus]